MNISELSYEKRCHMAYRLDSKTSCGLLTACAVARLDHGDMPIIDAFVKYGGCSDHSAKINARKVIDFVSKHQ